MLRHYIKIATRKFFRDKIFSLINILGLAVGMGVCLLIYQYIHFELSYDQFHENPQNIYRITQTAIKNGEAIDKGVDVTYALGPRGKETIPEIEDFVRVHSEDFGLIVINSAKNKRYQEDNMWYVDSNFLQMFDFPLIYGDKESALAEKHNIVITEQIATKYFGDTNPQGKALRVSGGTLSGDFIVTGVLKTPPTNSHLQFDFLLPMDFLLDHYRLYRESDGWVWENFVTYITVRESVDLSVVSKKFDQLITTYIGEKLARLNLSLETGFQPIVDVHLKSESLSGDFTNNNGSIQNVRFFVIIAIFILIIAWINYINLSTAHALNRAKEVGVRKSIGAKKKQLIYQFMVESALINSIAAMLAIGIAYCMIPVLNHIIGKELGFTVLKEPNFWFGFSLIVLFGTLLSGLYPAFVLSSFKPVSVFKSVKLKTTGGFTLRKSLIVFQFLMSVILLSSTYLVYQQIAFMKNQDLGYDVEKILVVNGPKVILETRRPELKSLYQTFTTEGISHHSISAISATSHIPGKGFIWSGNVLKVGDTENAHKEANAVFVDTNFFKTYDIEFLARTNFPSNVSTYEWVIINEEAVKVFGLSSPQDAISEELIVFDDTVKILGVVKNMHWSSLRDSHLPVLFMLDNEYGAYYSIKLNMSDAKESIAHIESTYHSVFPDDPFSYFFLEDDFNKQYQADLQFGNLFSAFSLLAIFIACLGLFALVSFSVTLRVKEIGIRKVLGASVGNLMVLLSCEYIVLMIIANVLAIPVIIFAARSWLNNFAFKIEIGIGLLLIPSIILFIISLLTVSLRTYTTATMSPTKSIQKE
jgi:putative ABC transport system permease protein